MTCFVRIAAVIVAGPCLAAGAEAEEGLGAVFRLKGEACILDEEHFGIAGGRMTLGVNHQDVGSVAGLWAPPFVSSDFLLQVRGFGEEIPTREYTWWPMEVRRSGVIRDLTFSSAVVVLPNQRAGVLTLDVENKGAALCDLPLDIAVSGTLDRTDTWEFSRPQSATPAPAAVDGDHLVKAQGESAIVIRNNVSTAQWAGETASLQTAVRLAPGERTRVTVAFAIGSLSDAMASCNAILADVDRTLSDAREAYERRARGIFDALPTLESSSEPLVAYYNRSLVHLLMNRWEVPEFVLNPYYSTGSVKGGCVCNYLWNFGEVWEILPLYDPRAAREHIKQFLLTDITTHFAFMPITGEAFGPWYPVNQEKILGLIFYYVKNTGDVGFLEDTVAGKSVLDWVLHHALWGDDPAKPVSLIDYGPSNSHLELRRGYPYNHVMPDLNGRRYANYRMAYHLCDWAKKPAPYLLERAEALKAVLRERLWDPEARWFRFEDGQGGKDIRYTVQMFKLFGSSVLDADLEAGLLGHINETEFLSEQGLHSMSKTDVAYDQVDIDNGGGGICTCFTPQIAERLYRSGHADVAADLIKRTLWWGERMPYWGDSLVANSIEYRKDTPLQCTLDGAAAAQCIIFGMFGVSASINGDIVVDPRPPDFAPSTALKGLRLRGVTLDILVDQDAYEVDVKTSGQSTRARIGSPVLIPADGAPLSVLPASEKPRSGL